MATMATFPPIHPSYDLPIRPIANDIYDFQDMDLPHWTQFLREDFNDDDWLTFIHDFGGPNSAYIPQTDLCATLELSPFQTPPTPEPEPNLTQKPDVTADMQTKQQFNNVTDMLSLQEDGKMDCEESKPPCLVEVKQEQFEDISESETKMDNEEMGKQEPLQFRDDEVFPKTEERPARSCNSRYAFRHILGASTKPSRPTVRKTVVLWKFLEELLDTNENNCVVWVSREEGTFKFVDSKLAAKLWGQKKNKRNMTYEKLSRALRYYYDRQIMFHEEGQKLIYRFGDIVMKNRKPSVAEAS